MWVDKACCKTHGVQLHSPKLSPSPLACVSSQLVGDRNGDEAHGNTDAALRVQDRSCAGGHGDAGVCEGSQGRIADCFSGLGLSSVMRPE